MSARLTATYTPTSPSRQEPRRARHTVLARRLRQERLTPSDLGLLLEQHVTEIVDQRVATRFLPITESLRDLVGGVLQHVTSQQVPPRHRWNILRRRRLSPPPGP